MSIENETMAIVLSADVVKSLQSTCDASNVVAQLRETLELTQEALENPDPESTRLIRSFAMIAKGENRLDVVEYLTPNDSSWNNRCLICFCVFAFSVFFRSLVLVVLRVLSLQLATKLHERAIAKLAGPLSAP